MTRAALYIRVSTAEQVEFYGLASQQTALLKRVEERQYTLVRDGDKQTFMDDGYSGGDMSRPALDRLRTAVREGQVDVVLSYDPDRLSRNLSELLLLANEIEAAGARLEFITQEMDSSPEGKMFFAIRGAVAEYEKAKIRERTMRGLREKARQGKLVNPRNLPKWLHWNAATQQVEMDEEWTQVARLAYRLVDEEGRGPRSIAARFMTLGIRSPSGASVWGESTLRKWLRDPAAKGQYAQMRYEHMEPPHRLKALGGKRNTGKRLRPEKEWQILPVPPVVSADVWERVQRRLDFNKDMALRNAKRDYLLRGFLRCGSCGRRMTGRYRNWERTRYYRCPHGNDRGFLGDDVCRQPIVRADDIEQAVWDALARLLHDPQLLLEELGRRREEGSATRTGLERELALVCDRLPVVPREMDRLIDGFGKGLIPDDRMRTRMSALTEERSQIEEKKKSLEARLLRLQQAEGIEDQVLAFVEKIRDKVDVLDEAGRRRLLELVLEDVTCHSDHAIVRTVIPPLDREPSGQLDASPQGGPRGMVVSPVGAPPHFAAILCLNPAAGRAHMPDVASRWYGPDEHEPTMALCEHLARATYDDIPDESRAYATRSIMDSFGNALAGTDSPSVKAALDMVRDWAGKPEARVLVSGERVPAPNAALVNTALARARLLDDMEEGVGDHPTVAPLHAAMAAAEMSGGCSGKQLIAAVTLASDLILRIRYAVHSETRAFAWCTESFAPLAAAVAVGKVIGFDANAFADALGIAYQQLSSTWLMHQEGASIHHLQHGLAARNGLLSALLARRGIKGTRNFIEREYGMIHAFGSTAYDRNLLLDGLGKHYRNVDVTLKRYPAAGFTCFAIDAARELLRRHAIAAADVQSVTVYVNERAYLRACQPEDIKKRPPSLVHAQLSIPYTTAATIVRGDFFLDELTPESLTDPAILGMAQRVNCVLDRELDKVSPVVAPVRMEMHLMSGQTHSIRVDYPRGHYRNPMTLDEIAEKFRRCAGYATPRLDKGAVDEAIAALRGLDAVPDVRDVMTLLTATRKRARTAPVKRRRAARK